MKVVFTHTDFRIYWPARLKAIDNFLKERNIDLEIIEIAGSGSPYDFAGRAGNHPANWHCLFPDKEIEEISSVDASRALSKKLDEIGPDIIFAGAIAYPSGATAARWAAKNNRKVVIFDNARLQDVPRPWRVNFIKKKVYSCADAVFCPSPAWNDTFNYFGFKDYQIFYGLNIVDNGFWLEEGQDIALDLPDNYILTVGRQIPKKNFLFLLKAYQAYTKKISDPQNLVLVGDGFRQQLLKEFAVKNGLNSVHFMSFVTQERLRNIYKRASYFVLPSKYGETWGLVVNEAMASGLPVLVSSQAGCASTLVKNGLNGFIFSPVNETELTELLLKMHNLTENNRITMGQKSLEIIKDWGLDRFCSGAYEALIWVSGQKKRKPDLITRVILKLWKGRYRPA